MAVMAAFSKSSSTASQEETNEQAAGEGGGAGSTTLVAGSGSVGAGGGINVQAGAGSSGAGAGLNAYDSKLGGTQTGGTGNTEITSIVSTDPAVAEAALESNTEVNKVATGAVVTLAGEALGDEEGTAIASTNAVTSTAIASIQEGAIEQQLNDQFGEEALQSAENSEAQSVTGLETAATESTVLGSNALAAAQNETLAGVTPAQEFQAVSAEPGVSSSSGGLSKIALYITIAVGVISLIYFFRKGKPA